jgi:hypothetical protein
MLAEKDNVSAAAAINRLNIFINVSPQIQQLVLIVV